MTFGFGPPGSPTGPKAEGKKGTPVSASPKAAVGRLDQPPPSGDADRKTQMFGVNGRASELYRIKYTPASTGPTNASKELNES
eukprot:CAMPEP_0177292216 /NCGR_PEP_ID=MMETSP0368-20130122/22_1 /TAXON_ID=447022 ORGANISM="Scrippsiella hangoei-like, Strain SHHI-4" /NCGR_SAMPLE_ID=MMETSP0368 /ASSEMBLY_ACC=CAM_ASM_000363 /LENGTH=82 /DNA_ID=CAMNT_0018749763 /DNA_START=30 /DNA_END=278 /DNA_ORIENTATION=-